MKMLLVTALQEGVVRHSAHFSAIIMRLKSHVTERWLSPNWQGQPLLSDYVAEGGGEKVVITEGSKCMREPLMVVLETHRREGHHEVARMVAERMDTRGAGYLGDGRFVCACPCNVPGAHPTLTVRAAVEGIFIECSSGCSFEGLVEALDKDGFPADLVPWLPEYLYVHQLSCA